MSALVIILCGGGGALVAWLVVSALGWTGVGAALAMLPIAMLVATGMFVVGIVIGRKIGWIR